MRRNRRLDDIKGLRVGGAPPVTGSVSDVIAQLQALPSGFAERNREVQRQLEQTDDKTTDDKTSAGALVTQAKLLLKKTDINKDTAKLDAAHLYLKAARLYGRQGKKLDQAHALSRAANCFLTHSHFLDSENKLNPQKAIQLLERAAALYASQRYWYFAKRNTDSLYTALCRTCRYYEQHDPSKVAAFAAKLFAVRQQARAYTFERQGGMAPDAWRIEEGEMGFSSVERIGTDNVSQCVTIILHNPVTKKTGLAHFDSQVNAKSLDRLSRQMGRVHKQIRLQIRLVGARFQNDAKSKQNITRIMEYLREKNVDIISADVYGGNEGPSSVVVDPQTNALEERVPSRDNANEDAANAVLLFTPDGKPLVTQFDLTLDQRRAPIKLGKKALQKFRSLYLGKSEWHIEAILERAHFSDRPKWVSFVKGLEAAYEKEWQLLTERLNRVIANQQVSTQDAALAREALHHQAFYVGENAQALNAPVYEWLEKQLFVDGALQKSATKGIHLPRNCYQSSHDESAEALEPVPEYRPVEIHLKTRAALSLPAKKVA